MTNMKTVVNVEILRGTLVKAMKGNDDAITSLQDMYAIYTNEGVNALFVNSLMDIMPSIERYAYKFVWNNSYTIDVNELINPLFEFMLSYDFISAWSEGKKVFATEEYFYSNVLSRVKNNYLKMNVHNTKGLIVDKRTEVRTFDDGVTMEIEVVDAYRKHVDVNAKGFTSMEFDAIEMKLDIHNALTEKERLVYKLFKEGYTVREINSMVTNGRKIRNSMMEKLESYYLQVSSDMHQVKSGIFDTSTKQTVIKNEVL